MPKIKTKSAKDTQKIAENLAKNFKGGVIALSGPLGSGKTTFTQGFANGLGIKDKIISPTFVLIRQHPIPKDNSTLYHVDLYRLDDSSDFKNIGIEDLINSKNDIVLIEWAEKIKKILPKKTLWVKFEVVHNDLRIMSW